MLPRALSKRQRSQSAESVESTSSNKRSNSGSSYSPVPAGHSHQHNTTTRMAALDLNNMSTGDEGPTSNDGSSSSSTEPLRSENGEAAAAAAAAGTGGPIPARAAPPEDGKTQLSIIVESAKKQFVEGDTWFVVDRRWYRRWQAACGSSSSPGEGDESDGKELEGITMGDVGPIDNSQISDIRTGKLTRMVVEGQDVVFLPGEAWHLLEAWFGTTGAPVSADVIQARDGLVLDLRPPVYTITKVVPSSSPDMPGIAKTLQTSSSWSIRMLKQIIAQGLECDSATPSRLWILDEKYTSATIKPEALVHASLEPAGDEDTIRDSSITEDSVIAFEQANEDGTWLVKAPAADDGAATISPVANASAPKAAPFGGPSFLDSITKTQPKRAVLTTVDGATTSTDQPVASTSNLAAASMRQTRSQTGASSGKKGLVGLTNLGNTCFMNSALQCLSNTPALQEYFHSGLWESELNPQNLLGMKGEVAKAYGNLVDKIWNGHIGVVTPREFKQTLSRFAPAFSGWQQHDSQELIAFLLDGLHEDLNRIKKKPYDDIPDWNGGGEKEELELANLSWELYKRRNDSVIVDLFQGQLRNRLTCPECGKIAIKFDPFMYLSLAIPQHKKWTGNVYLVPNDPARATVNVSLELSANASLKQLKQAVGDLTGYDAKRLFAIEEYTHKFFKVWSDSETVQRITSNDLILLHELPYEIEQPQYRPTKGKTPEEEGKIFVAVVSKVVSEPQQQYYNNRAGGIAEPFILGLTAEEACNIETIERKIGERLASWQAVGDKIWTTPASASAGGRPNGTASRARRNVIPDDEDGSDDADAVMVEQESAAETASPADQPSTLLNTDIVNIVVAKKWPPSSYGSQPFVELPGQDRFTLRERLRRRLQKLDAPTHARLPGSFTQEDADDLYGDADEANEAPVEGAQDDKAVPVSSLIADEPLFNTGEVILLEWNSQFVSKEFGPDAEKSRQLPSDIFSRQERVLDPVIAERNKLGNRRSDKAAITVDNLLDEFVKEEKLNEDNMWYCSSCKKHQEAPKKFDLWKMPDVLVIHLKRFSNERAFRDKIDTFIDFPVSGLDLTERVEGKKVAARLAAQGGPAELIEETGTNDSLVYDLFAVDNHYGGLGGGHYTAFAKNIMDGKWYNFDDSRVSPVSNPDEVKTSAAYLLFYVRRTSKPIGGKTHKILASRTVTPAMSSAGSRPASPAVDLSSSGQLHGSSSLRPPPYSYGADGDDDDMDQSDLRAEPDLSGDDGDMFETTNGALSSLAPPSPAMSDDDDDAALLDSRDERGFMSRSVGKIQEWMNPNIPSSSTTGWNFGAMDAAAHDSKMVSASSSSSSRPRDGSGSTSPGAVEIRLDEGEMAKAASSIDMGSSSHMDEVE